MPRKSTNTKGRASAARSSAIRNPRATATASKLVRELLRRGARARAIADAPSTDPASREYYRGIDTGYAVAAMCVSEDFKL